LAVDGRFRHLIRAINRFTFSGEQRDAPTAEQPATDRPAPIEDDANWVCL
jgi:hypothetical protein